MTGNNGAKIISVIETVLLRRGVGTAEDPMHAVTQYWSTEGELLAERGIERRRDPAPAQWDAAIALLRRSIAPHDAPEHLYLTGCPRCTYEQAVREFLEGK